MRKWISYVNAFESYRLPMRALSYAWSLPVTWQRWRSQHLIRHSQNLMLHAKFMALCFTEPELLPTEVLHCMNKDFRPVFAPWPWPWPNNLHIRTWFVFARDITDMQIWTSYVKVFEIYRLRDINSRQTDTAKVIIPSRFAGIVVNYFVSKF